VIYKAWLFSGIAAAQHFEQTTPPPGPAHAGVAGAWWLVVGNHSVTAETGGLTGFGESSGRPCTGRCRDGPSSNLKVAWGVRDGLTREPRWLGISYRKRYRCTISKRSKKAVNNLGFFGLRRAQVRQQGGVRAAS
jgi:hypothetical protein